MKKQFYPVLLLLLTVSLVAFRGQHTPNTSQTMDNTIYQFSAADIDGNQQSLSQYKGKVVVIVNVASKCGFTPQYEGLQALYEQYRHKGLVILGFPCNQFASQEPGTAADIKSFCSLNYGVDFPMFAKIDVNGDNAHPLYKFLKDQKSGLLGTKAIKWNFTKFLIDRDGKVVERFSPQTKPADMGAAIEKLL